MKLGVRAPTDARIKLDGRVLKARRRRQQRLARLQHKGEQVAKAERDEKIPSVFSRVRLQPHVRPWERSWTCSRKVCWCWPASCGDWRSHGAALK